MHDSPLSRAAVAGIEESRDPLTWLLLLAMKKMPGMMM